MCQDQSSDPHLLSDKLCSKRTQHQVLLSNLYNKIIFAHLNPFTSQVQIYELDPTFTYKNQLYISVP